MKLTNGCAGCEQAAKNRAAAAGEEHEVFACRKGHEQPHSGSCDTCGARVTTGVRWEHVA